MFDVGCLFGKEEFEVAPIFGACGIVLPGITWQAEKSSVFDRKEIIATDLFLIEWLFYSFRK